MLMMGNGLWDVKGKNYDEGAEGVMDTAAPRCKATMPAF
jgi:hypothetical protein